MQTIIERIENAGQHEIGELLQAVTARYQQLYPQWQISSLCLEKAADKNEQLDKIIALLQNMKEN